MIIDRHEENDCRLRLLIFLALPLVPGCGAPEVTWPETSFEGKATTTLRIGAAAAPITPESFVFLAGGITYGAPLGVHDDLWA